MESISFFSSSSSTQSCSPQFASQQPILLKPLIPRLLGVIHAIRNIHTWLSPQDFSRLACANTGFATGTHYVWKQLYFQTNKKYQNSSPANHISATYIPQNYQSAYLQLKKLTVPLHTPGLILTFSAQGCSEMVI